MRFRDDSPFPYPTAEIAAFLPSTCPRIGEPIGSESLTEVYDCLEKTITYRSLSANSQLQSAWPDVVRSEVARNRAACSVAEAYLYLVLQDIQLAAVCLNRILDEEVGDLRALAEDCAISLLLADKSNDCEPLHKMLGKLEVRCLRQDAVTLIPLLWKVDQSKSLELEDFSAALEGFLSLCFSTDSIVAKRATQGLEISFQVLRQPSVELNYRRQWFKRLQGEKHVAAIDSSNEDWLEASLISYGDLLLWFRRSSEFESLRQWLAHSGLEHLSEELDRLVASQNVCNLPFEMIAESDIPYDHDDGRSIQLSTRLRERLLDDVGCLCLAIPDTRCVQKRYSKPANLAAIDYFTKEFTAQLDGWAVLDYLVDGAGIVLTKPLLHGDRQCVALLVGDHGESFDLTVAACVLAEAGHEVLAVSALKSLRSSGSALVESAHREAEKLAKALQPLSKATRVP